LSWKSKKEKKREPDLNPVVIIINRTSPLAFMNGFFLPSSPLPPEIPGKKKPKRGRPERDGPLIFLPVEINPTRAPLPDLRPRHRGKESCCPAGEKLLDSIHLKTALSPDGGVAQSPKNAHVLRVRSAFSSPSRLALERNCSFPDGNYPANKP